MSGFVDHCGHHSLNRANEGDASVGLEGPTTISGHIHNVTDPLAHLYGHLSELASHGIDGGVGSFVVTEDPRVATLHGLAIAEVEAFNCIYVLRQCT